MNWLKKLYRKMFPKKETLKFELIQKIEIAYDDDGDPDRWVNQPQCEYGTLYVVTSTPKISSVCDVTWITNEDSFYDQMFEDVCWEHSQDEERYLWKQVK